MRGVREGRVIGSQFDVVVDYAPARFLDLSLGYSVLAPGAFIEDTGPDETVQFLGLEVLFRF